ncbi:MAG TPA: SRPBCC domain-containing protein [Burkholderiales bacterium]
MRIDKTCELPFPLELAWTRLTNPELVGACVPGVEKVERVDDTHFAVTVTVKLGVVRPTFRLNISLAEQIAPRYLRSHCAGEANGMLGSLRQSTEVHLAPLGESATRLDVSAEFDVFGRLGTFGYGMLKGKADQLWEQFVRNFSAAEEDTRCTPTTPR